MKFPITTALLAISLAACGGAHTLSKAEQTTAELGARQFAERSGSDFISCSGMDSDNDGYVTCTVKDKVTRANTNIVCAFIDNSGGCKTK